MYVDFMLTTRYNCVRKHYRRELVPADCEELRRNLGAEGRNNQIKQQKPLLLFE